MEFPPSKSETMEKRCQVCGKCLPEDRILRLCDKHIVEARAKSQRRQMKSAVHRYLKSKTTL